MHEIYAESLAMFEILSSQVSMNEQHREVTRWNSGGYKLNINNINISNTAQAQQVQSNEQYEYGDEDEYYDEEDEEVEVE